MKPATKDNAQLSEDADRMVVFNGRGGYILYSPFVFESMPILTASFSFKIYNSDKQ